MATDRIHRNFSVVPYDPKWNDLYADEKKVLDSVFSHTALSIEHIGSTSVEGLAGKPTIDVLITVNNIEDVVVLNQDMEAVGYEVLGDYVLPDASLFVKEVDDVRLSNVHVFQKDHPHVKEILHLRDYLRSHPERVVEYCKLKFDLFEKYPHDYVHYRKSKDEWMEKLKHNIRDK